MIRSVQFDAITEYRKAVIAAIRAQMKWSSVVDENQLATLQHSLRTAQAKVDELESRNPELPLLRLQRVFRLDEATELKVLKFLWAVGEDRQIAEGSQSFAAHCARPSRQSSVQETADFRPTLCSLRRVFKAPDPDLPRDLLSPHRPLRKHRLIDIQQRDYDLLDEARLSLDERMAAILNGYCEDLDHRLELLFRCVPEAAILISKSQARAGERMRKALERALRASECGFPTFVAHLRGPSSHTLGGVVRQVIHELSGAAKEQVVRRLYRLDADLLPEHGAELAQAALLWQREAQFCDLALIVDAYDLERSGEDAPRRVRLLRQFLSYEPGAVFVLTRSELRGLGDMNISIDVTPTTVLERRDFWLKQLEPDQQASSPEARQTAGELAAQFRLELATIKQAVELVHSEEYPVDDEASFSGMRARRERKKRPSDRSDRHPLHHRLWQICRELSRPRLESLATLVESSKTWEDLVLPDRCKEILRRIIEHAQCRTQVFDDWGFGQGSERGLGLGALFAGASGTGKTLAAEVIANELELDLYRIDLSNVVNKYVGETEKNLRQLFDAAEQGGGVLFFDEADCLFGKRTEVRDSHDRFANIQIDYLLQRMETYQGIVILATNFLDAIDTAFHRRLRFINKFPVPDQKMRAEIYKSMFAHLDPAKSDAHQPIQHDLDFEQLSRLDVTGGTIRNITVGTAFLTAASGLNSIGMKEAQQAARIELEKLGRPISDADFLWQPARAKKGAG